jgi:hypothetical protein
VRCAASSTPGPPPTPRCWPGRRRPEWPLRAADDYLAGVGHALLAWAWARIAAFALQPQAAAEPGTRPAAQWLDAARFGVQWLLPQAAVHWARIGQRDAALPEVATP